jgi:hypothetical protein
VDGKSFDPADVLRITALEQMDVTDGAEIDALNVRANAFDKALADLVARVTKLEQA